MVGAAVVGALVVGASVVGACVGAEVLGTAVVGAGVGASVLGTTVVGAWVGADSALGFHQRLRLQLALRSYLDRVPWPGRLSFQRVSWKGWECRFHPPEDWGALALGDNGPFW